ncbi:protein zwilch [Culicoides brevitarsis]|uniref:protein zwilch n=1 Tax=Culicoides brevitarsis TaxID=469753 RepID=UPI00307C680F
MDSKLINVYVFLREHYQDLDVLHSAPTSYIKTISGNDSKRIVFVHKFVKKSSIDTTKSPCSPIKVEKSSLTPINNTKDDSTVVGSPLRDDCDVEELCVSPVNLVAYNPWSEIEENYTGISHEEALELLNELHSSNVTINDNGSVWILVKADDIDRTFLLELEIKNGFFSRGVVSLNGIRSLQDIDVMKLIEQNRKMVRDAINTEIRVDTSYTFYNNTTLSFRHSSENELKSSSSFLHNNECTIRQIFNLKEATQDTSEFLNQIFMLNELFELIVQFKEEYGDEDFKEPEYRKSSGVDMEIVNNQIVKILSAFPEKLQNVEIDRKSLLEAVLSKANQRQLEDSTDQLFDILKFCGSLRDLKSAFQLIFQTSLKCNVVNMPSANTKLGELIRDVSERRIAVPVLTGSQPLELLLEIGLEKAIRDYDYIFEESRICSASDLKIVKKDASIPIVEKMNVRKSLHNLATKTETENDNKQRKTLLHKIDSVTTLNESVIGFQNSRFNETEIQTKLSRLLQIHLILEHLLLVQVNLGTGNIHSAIAKQMLKEEPIKLKKILRDGFNKLEVSVVDHKLKYLIENKSPSAKRISVVSENKFKKLETVNYYCIDPIFPVNVYREIFKEEEAKTVEKGSRKETYWHFTYTKFSSKR